MRPGSADAWPQRRLWKLAAGYCKTQHRRIFETAALQSEGAPVCVYVRDCVRPYGSSGLEVAAGCGRSGTRDSRQTKKGAKTLGVRGMHAQIILMARCDSLFWFFIPPDRVTLPCLFVRCVRCNPSLPDPKKRGLEMRLLASAPNHTAPNATINPYPQQPTGTHRGPQQAPRNDCPSTHPSCTSRVRTAQAC